MKLGDVVEVTGLAEYTGTGKGKESRLKAMRTRCVAGKVIHIANKHFTIHNGVYRESFLFVDYPKLGR